ncbi:MAG: cation-translocating P-type ATPase [Anaerolineae bacterium]|nr:cation-translocating P-type ATPase [Anaerolineae bacterium]
MSDWHRLGVSDVLAHFRTDPENGLTQAEAERRLQEHGPNELIERGMKSPWLILWEQLTALMVLILIVAAVVSAALGDYKDAAAIGAIIVLNAVLGFIQEYRAEKAILALKKMAVPRVRVRRDGHVREISARDLVPGDIVFLEAGALVPVDGRLIESVNLQVQEAALTGESSPVEKVVEALPDAQLALGDRRNMVYMGTVVTYGRGMMIATETGMRTELGRIADMIQTVKQEQTPLQRRMDQLGRGLAVAALGIVALVFFLGILRGEELRLMFLTAISMAVAAVPEGLPAVVTIALALGAQRMLKRHALIRKLPAVETLGSVTVICSDKTGTLTENRMTVTVLDIAGHTINLMEMLERKGTVWADASQSSYSEPDAALRLVLTGAALCNDAVLENVGGESRRLHAVGDPTEGALLIAAAQFGLLKPELERAMPRVAEAPFTSERKRMSVAVRNPLSHNPNTGQAPSVLFDFPRYGLQNIPWIVFSKGAVDSLLEVSTQVWVEGEARPLDTEWRERIIVANNRLAQDGMRVLGVAFRPLHSLPENGVADALERDLIFVGMVGMIDPPRPEVKDAVHLCKTAGIRPVMITGDHPLTAQHIARVLDLASDGRVLTGQELERVSTEELEAVVEEVPIYARVSPEHKLKIVEALQRRHHIVAMTGDGVNDAPALKKADIGVAMGITGTDVSKEAADMVLLDDNFATIVAAVEEGRTIFDNIRKFVKYTMTSNSGEIWVMLLAPFLGMPLPLLPLQILWINLVTDGLPGLAMTIEPSERDVMRRPPYHPQMSIFAQGLGRHIIWVGLLMGLVSLLMGYWAWYTGHPTWQTMVFTTLTLSQMGHALAIRSGRDSLFKIGLLSNKALLGAVSLTFVLQLAVVYVPFLQGIFRTVALPVEDLFISLVLSTVVFWAVEVEKWWLRRSGVLQIGGER